MLVFFSDGDKDVAAIDVIDLGVNVFEVLRILETIPIRSDTGVLLVVDVIVVADTVNVDVAKMGNRNVEVVVVVDNDVLNAIKESVIVVDVLEVLDVVEDVVVVVVSHPLQVLAQCVILATLLLHKPCFLKA